MGKLTTSINVSFTWSGTHRWPGASGRHDYLRHTHRHLFHGTVEVEVGHHDREIEFFELLDQLNKMTDDYTALGTHSCEWVATDIIWRLRDLYGPDRRMLVSVYEDNENGAVVEWTP